MKLATTIFIAVLIGCIAFFICNPPKVPEYTIKIDTTRNVNYNYNPQPIAEISSKPDKIPDTLLIYKDTLYLYGDTLLLIDTLFLTDTVFVYNDYFVKRVYADTLQNDSNAFVFVRDTIFQNRLLNRFSDIQTYNETKIIQGDPVFLSVGIFHVNNGLFNSTGIKTGLENAKNEFNVGYGTGKTLLFEYERKFNLKPLKLRPWKRIRNN